ncbi:MAG: hypothetical protein AB7P24_11835 [Nitrospira sp.]
MSAGLLNPGLRATRLAAIGVLALLMLGAVARTPRAGFVVYVIPVEGIIDLGLAPFVERALDEAAAAGAAAVILDIDTFGGRVDAAVQIRDALLRARVKTVAFINKRTISAGALISLAADTIVMAEGGTIGAATPVQIGLPGSPAGRGEDGLVPPKGIPRDGGESHTAAGVGRSDGGCGCGNSRRDCEGQVGHPDDRRGVAA